MKTSEISPTKSAKCAYRVIGESALIIDMVHFDKNKLCCLNESGTQVWELLDGDRSLDQVIDMFIDVYDVEREQAEKDIKAFLSTLAEKKLIDLRPAQTVAEIGG